MERTITAGAHSAEREHSMRRQPEVEPGMRGGHRCEMVGSANGLTG